MEDRKQLAEMIKLHRSAEVSNKTYETSSEEDDEIGSISKNQLNIVIVVEKICRRIKRLETAMGEMQDITDDILGRIDEMEGVLPEILVGNKYR